MSRRRCTRTRCVFAVSMGLAAWTVGSAGISERQCAARRQRGGLVMGLGDMHGKGRGQSAPPSFMRMKRGDAVHPAGRAADRRQFGQRSSPAFTHLATPCRRPEAAPPGRDSQRASVRRAARPDRRGGKRTDPWPDHHRVADELRMASTPRAMSGIRSCPAESRSFLGHTSIRVPISLVLICDSLRPIVHDHAESLILDIDGRWVRSCERHPCWAESTMSTRFARSRRSVGTARAD
jgi:hypothetical protein